MQEIWKDVVGYEEYFKVSECGEIYSKRTNKILKQVVTPKGYKIFSTRFGGKDSLAKTFKVHRLVAEAFLESPSPELTEACSKEHYGKVIVRHLDNNKLNNNYKNLAWGTSKDNTDDWMKTLEYLTFRENNAGCKNKNSKLSAEEVLYIRANYKPRDKIFGARPLAIVFGVHHKRICDVASGKTYK